MERKTLYEKLSSLFSKEDEKEEDKKGTKSLYIRYPKFLDDKMIVRKKVKVELDSNTTYQHLADALGTDKLSYGSKDLYNKEVNLDNHIEQGAVIKAGPDAEQYLRMKGCRVPPEDAEFVKKAVVWHAAMKPEGLELHTNYGWYKIDKPIRIDIGEKVTMYCSDGFDEGICDMHKDKIDAVTIDGKIDIILSKDAELIKWEGQ